MKEAYTIARKLKDKDEEYFVYLEDGKTGWSKHFLNPVYNSTLEEALFLLTGMQEDGIVGLENDEDSVEIGLMK